MPGPLDVTSPDWPAQAADRVVGVVDSIRDKTTVPLQTVARGIVYGFVAAVMGIAAVVLLAIAAVRFVDVWIPGNVWRAHAIVGMLFTLIGLFLWSRRRRKD
jgi:hypothetical protein